MTIRIIQTLRDPFSKISATLPGSSPRLSIHGLKLRVETMNDRNIGTNLNISRNPEIKEQTFYSNHYQVTETQSVKHT